MGCRGPDPGNGLSWAGSEPAAQYVAQYFALHI
jgi:hypothetical protein